MFEAQKLLTLKEGLFVQPEAATTLAACLKLKDRFSGRSVLILTGHGLKAAELPASRSQEHYQARLEEVDSLFEKIMK
jgi:threonine synthase